MPHLRTFTTAAVQMAAKERSSIIPAGSAEAKDVQRLPAGHYTSYAAGPVNMELNQPLEVNLSISAQPHNKHQFRSGLRHIIEGSLGSAPKSIGRGGDAINFGNLALKACIRGLNHGADRGDAKALKPFRHALQGALSGNVQNGKRTRAKECVSVLFNVR
jgi:hypothetical protein